jgi:hypothetical protein
LEIIKYAVHRAFAEAPNAMNELLTGLAAND